MTTALIIAAILLVLAYLSRAKPPLRQWKGIDEEADDLAGKPRSD